MTKQRSNGQQRYLSISVDDGHPDDLRTAELLEKHGLPATFYIPARNPERPLMGEADVRRIAEQFEVGAHTMNHRPLRGLPAEVLREEVSAGKHWLEQVAGQSVESFCYPKGKYDRAALAAVARAGFLGARTCRFNLLDFPSDPQCWGVATHAYSHSRSIQLRHALLEGNFQGIANYVSIFQAATDWVDHFRQAVRHVERAGGVAHLYFHSWEITSTGQWQRLEALLQEVVQTNLQAVTNAELFRIWHERNKECRPLSPR